MKFLKEFGKQYFKNLLQHEHQNMRYGDTLTIRISFINKNGEIEKVQQEKIHKKEL